MLTLGSNIKKARLKLGLTQEELSFQLGVTSQAVSRWESGAGMPDISMIVPLAQTLSVSTDALFGLEQGGTAEVQYMDIKTQLEEIAGSAASRTESALQQNKLNLQNSIQSSLAYAYKKNNPKITHFYNNIGYSDVPVWALFEIMTMGDLGYLLSCLTYDVRDAIAHNAVVFDTRFRNIDPTSAMKQCLKLEIGLPYVNFKTIGDYIILMCYYRY